MWPDASLLSSVTALAYGLLGVVLLLRHVRSLRPSRVAAGVVSMVLALLLVHPGPWHPNHHGIEVFLDALDQSLWAPASLGHAHGQGLFVLFRGLSPIADPPTVQLLLAFVCTQLLGAAVGAMASDEETGDWAAWWWALFPVTLRLSRTGTFMLAYVALCAAGVWFARTLASHVDARDDDTPQWAPALGLGAVIGLAAHTYSAAAVFVPYVIGLTLVHQSGWRITALTRELVFAGLVAAPALLTRVVASGTVGAAGQWQEMGPLGHPGAPVIMVATGLMWLLSRRLAKPSEPHASSASWMWMAAGGLAVLVGAASAACFDDGEATHLGAALGYWVPLFDTNRANPLWWLVVGAGLASLHHQRGVSWVLAIWAPHALLFGLNQDGHFGSVRFALPMVWMLAWPAGLGLQRLHARLAGVGPRTLALPGVMVLLTCAHAGWLGHVFPNQVVWGLMTRARAEAGDHTTLHTLLASDIPPALHPKVQVPYRQHLKHLLPDGRVRPLSAQPRAGDLYLRPAACFRPLVGTKGDTLTAYAYPAETVIDRDHSPPWAVTTTQPYWHWPDDPRVDLASWMDPACQSFESAHDLEPIVEVPLPPTDGNLEFSVVLSTHPVVGLYRVRGKVSP